MNHGHTSRTSKTAVATVATEAVRFADRRQGIDLNSVVQAYRRYAPVYDLVFGPFFHWGRVRTVERANALPCRSVLEVGVGTGLSLPLYNPAKRIVGVDISAEMLASARKRVEAKRLASVNALLEMDAERLSFADESFDAAVAMYVLSTVPHPQRALAEIQRIVKPGGTILICNHLAGQGQRWAAARLDPLSRWLGWRPGFSLGDLLDGSSLEVAAVAPVPPFGFFSLVELCKG